MNQLFPTSTAQATAFISVPESAAKRAAEMRYALELIANDDHLKLEAFARLHGWTGPHLNATQELNKLSAIRHIADMLTLPFAS